MIYGTPTLEKKQAEQRAILNMIYGRRQFAWLPVTLHDGTKLWLGHYYAYYRGLVNEDKTHSLWSASPDSYHPYSENRIEQDPSAILITGESREVVMARLERHDENALKAKEFL
jgi:hypothetical protein